MKSLQQFIQEKTGQYVAVPWGFKGQCVSLVQMYLAECFGYPLYHTDGRQFARGHAKDWSWSLVQEGIATKVTSPRYGDIIVYGSTYGGGYGHIGIWLTPTSIFDQNNSTGGRSLAAGIGAILPNPIAYLRLHRSLVPDTKERTEAEHKLVANTILYSNHNYGTGATRKQRLEAEGYNYAKVQKYINGLIAGKPAPKPVTKEYVQLSKEVTTGWRVYPLNKEPVVKNAIGSLQPHKFGGLEYEILARPMTDLVTIQTRDWGKVNIYIGKETAHKIVRK